MKKIIIGLSGMVLIALVVVLFVNAQGGKAETKKAATEVSAGCAGCPSAATCTHKTETVKASCCDSTKAATGEGVKMEACESAKAGCEATCTMKHPVPVK